MGLEKLLRVRYSLHYQFLCGYYTYYEMCDYWEVVLIAVNELRREDAPKAKGK